MWVYAGRRLLLAIPTLLGASIIVFAMVHLAPGDPIAAVMPAESSKAEIEAIKHAYGFDKPLPVQYLVWLGHVARGDLGKSIATRLPRWGSSRWNRPGWWSAAAAPVCSAPGRYLPGP